jgi:hypothetical protein
MRGGKKPLCLVGVAAILLVTTLLSGAEAQYLADQINDADAARLRFNPSPRLAGMGLLGITVEDENSEINLFDYIGSPVGLLNDRDTTSVDFQYDFARNKTDWSGVDPWAYSPEGPLWPNFLDFGGADLQTRYRYQRYNALAAYRMRDNLSIGARLDYTRSSYANDITKFDVTYITAVGEEDEAEPDTMFVGEAVRDSVSDVKQWVFDILVDKEVNENLNVGGHAIFTFETLKPKVFHSPDSLTVEITRPVIVDTTAVPHSALRLSEIPRPSGDAQGAGGGLAFSYRLGDYVTLGATGDIFATDEKLDLQDPFFRQEIRRDTFLKTGNVHSLFKLGRALEGAIKHQSKNMSGDGEYFWSYGCPIQGGDFDDLTVKGVTADRDGWEERTGTRWLIRVPETSIRIGMEYESTRGEYKVTPDSAYSGDVFEVPGECGDGGENDVIFPRYAVLVDDVPVEIDYEQKTFNVGAGLTLWFGRRAVTLGSEYSNWQHDASDATGARGSRELAQIKFGAEADVTNRVTVRAGHVWGEERRDPSGEVWDESTLTLGGSYVLAPGMKHIEVAYMYRTREPDFEDIFDRKTVDHRLTAYTRLFF